MQLNKRAGTTIGVLIVALVVGCGTVQTQERLTALDDSIRTYAKTLRWAEYEEAARYMVFREREPVSIDFEALEKIRITAYEVYDRELNTEQDEASISVRIEYYHEDTGVVNSLKDKQLWWFSLENERWFLDDSLPDFVTLPKRRGG